MSGVLPTAHLERFRAVIARRLGLHLDEGRSRVLVDVLQRRLVATGREPDAYVSRLERYDEAEEVGALARELTVPETYFFRSRDQFSALTEVVIPERLARRAAERQLRILSLGCASGEEAYSLAIRVRDTFDDPGWDVSILGVDVSAAAIEKAKRGRYSAWALRDTPADDRERWFRRDGRDFVLDPAVRALVRFEQRNLVNDDPRLWQSGPYDVVFCRNVIMYFAPEQAQAVIARVASVLAPGGYLFLGYAETLRGVSTDFHLLHTHGTFYYQRRDRSDVAPSNGSLTRERPAPAAAADADTWVGAIRRASERVAELTAPRAAERLAISNEVVPPKPAWDLGVVLELLRHERFAEALALVDALPADSDRDPDVLLLRSVLLAHGGQLALAEQACRRLLEVDELSAGAHYLLALCREGAGDRSAAVHHNQVAVYLDPGFAMPHLHLGLLASRSGAAADARRDLGRALVLLHREDASRVLLFGGGFAREALVALCRTELVRCGGTA